MTLRVKEKARNPYYYKHFDTPCHVYLNDVTDTECQNVYNTRCYVDVY
jgi:hypothetical protein